MHTKQKTRGKDFEKWFKIKSSIEGNNHILLFAERDIWWCSIGLNLGDEQDGKNDFFERPVVIFRKFNNDIFWGLPMSTKIKNNQFNFKYSFNNQFQASILLSQLRLMSSKRLIRKLSKIHPSIFEKIRESLISLAKPTPEKNIETINKSDPSSGSSDA